MNHKEKNIYLGSTLMKNMKNNTLRLLLCYFLNEIFVNIASDKKQFLCIFAKKCLNRMIGLKQRFRTFFLSRTTLLYFFIYACIFSHKHFAKNICLYSLGMFLCYLLMQVKIIPDLLRIPVFNYLSIFNTFQNS